MNGDGDRVGKTSDGFINRVVDDLPTHVLQATRVSSADVHARDFTNRGKTFEYFDVISGVGGGRFLCRAAHSPALFRGSATEQTKPQ